MTAVELMPVFQFDAQDSPPGLVNYWGYAPVSFFAPHQAYSSRQDPLGPLDEFRDMVKALHRAGIEVILDVVFNHTAEGDHNGPTLSLRGFDNSTYYILDKDRARYANYSGTGNTLNANQPIVRRMIVDSLRYWVEEMHVDGFRFDLAAILARDESGQLLPNPPVLWDIESDPVLAGTKLIAEAWDAAGLYQVGSFVGDSWKEWNGRFRDDVRSFFRGEDGSVGRFADRLLGSPAIYGHKEREAEQSINYVTCHDGFTVNDLVSYNQKHNEANGEDNRDGANDNRSWNCGVEGPTDDPAVEQLRNRQVKNFLAVTMLSAGMPMILMGDEARRTQHGNNNAYCQDNETSWFDWTLLAKHARCSSVRDSAQCATPCTRGITFYVYLAFFFLVERFLTRSTFGSAGRGDRDPLTPLFFVVPVIGIFTWMFLQHRVLPPHPTWWSYAAGLIIGFAGMAVRASSASGRSDACSPCGCRSRRITRSSTPGCTQASGIRSTRDSSWNGWRRP